MALRQRHPGQRRPIPRETPSPNRESCKVPSSHRAQKPPRCAFPYFRAQRRRQQPALSRAAAPRAVQHLGESTGYLDYNLLPSPRPSSEGYPDHSGDAPAPGREVAPPAPQTVSVCYSPRHTLFRRTSHRKERKIKEKMLRIPRFLGPGLYEVIQYIIIFLSLVRGFWTWN
jgi:hypothetical protein